MKIIDRYIIREVFYTLLAVMPLLLLIFVGHRLADYLGDIVSGKFTREILLPLLALKSLGILEVLLPLVFYLSVLLALGRLYKDSEMIVLAACGVGPARVLKAVFVSALLVTVLVGVLSMLISPWAAARGAVIIERAETAPAINALVAGRFKESSTGDQVFYAEAISPDQKILRNIFVQGREADKITVLSAQTAQRNFNRATGDQQIVLRDGKRYEWTPGQADHTLIEYEKYTLSLPHETLANAPVKERAMATSALLILDSSSATAEFQWRVSRPLSVLLLALLAVALSRTTPRQGRYAKLFIAIAAFIIYDNTLGIAQTWLERGQVPPWLGMWWVHVLLLLIIVALFVAQHGGRSWRRYPWMTRAQAKP